MSRGAVAKLQVESIAAPEREPPHLKIAPDPAAGADSLTGKTLYLGADSEVWEAGRRFSTDLLDRFRFLRGLRPAALGSILVKLLGPDDRRRIIRAENGLRIYADPFSHLGGAVLEDGRLESDTEQVLRDHVRPGGIFLDIGANEGYFSALAGKLVGPRGFVVAIEPQSRLRDIIEVNLRLNDVGRYRVYTNAFGADDGVTGTINLWPSHNTGASSLMSSYRFSRSTETVRFVSLDRIFAETGIDRVDFVKVDVEGFEGQVARSLEPHLREKRIGTLFLDYHAKILAHAGIDPRSIHQRIVSSGYRMVGGDETHFESYRLYQPTND
jgi:FkbM family methyltransferase